MRREEGEQPATGEMEKSSEVTLPPPAIPQEQPPVPIDDTPKIFGHKQHHEVPSETKLQEMS